jgi:hypothetical protein
MSTLTNTIECVKHVPAVEAISTVSHSFDDSTQYTFCIECEQNIDRFSFYDDDRGIVYSKWGVTK